MNNSPLNLIFNTVCDKKYAGHVDCSGSGFGKGLATGYGYTTSFNLLLCNGSAPGYTRGNGDGNGYCNISHYEIFYGSCYVEKDVEFDE